VTRREMRRSEARGHSTKGAWTAEGQVRDREALSSVEKEEGRVAKEGVSR